MASTLAKIRLIADSIDCAFRGSNQVEIEQIKQIRKEFAPYLFASREDTPSEIVDRLGPMADELIAGCKVDKPGILEMCLNIYEGEEEKGR